MRPTPEERKANPLKLSKAQIFSTPRLDILHPINTDWTSKDMSKAEDMELLKSLPWLRSKSQESSPLLCPLGLSQGEVKFLVEKKWGQESVRGDHYLSLPHFPLFPPWVENMASLLQGITDCASQSVVTVKHAPACLQKLTMKFQLLMQAKRESYLQDSIQQTVASTSIPESTEPAPQPGSHFNGPVDHQFRFQLRLGVSIQKLIQQLLLGGAG